MESRQIIISESAYHDLEKIESYISEDSPTIAQRFIEQIFNKVEQLHKYPEFGKIVRELQNQQIRELIFKKYRIVYQILDSENIVVLRVIHGSRLLDLERE